MKKVFVLSAIALAALVSCNTEPKEETGANGKAVIKVAEDALVAYLPMARSHFKKDV